MNKTRVTFIVILAVMVVLAAVAIIFSITKDSRSANKLIDNSSKQADEIDSKHMRDFKIIDVDKYLELYNGDTASVVVIGRTGCEYCSIAEPILKNISEFGDLFRGKDEYVSNCDHLDDLLGDCPNVKELVKRM